MVEQIFLSPQVKWSMIISNKLVYSAQSPDGNENLTSTCKNLLKKQKLSFSGSAPFNMKTSLSQIFCERS